MLSLRGKIAVGVVRKFFNFNPKKCPEPFKKIGFFSKKSIYKPPKGYTLDKFQIESLPVEILKKEGEQSKNVVYLLHGGAYIAGMADMYRKVAKKYSIAANGAIVVMIDYRTAPKHIFPSALEDALKGWSWLIKNGYKAENILIVGDSAGGNLALALMLKLKEQGKEMPKAVVLMSPWADMTASGKSYLENYKKDAMFGAKEEVNEEMVEKLLSSKIYSFCGEHNRKNPLISPVFGDYEGFPPMFISVGSHEILLSDSQTIAQKMQNAGSQVTLHIGEGMYHVYPMFYSLFPEARKTMKLITDFIKKQFEN